MRSILLGLAALALSCAPVLAQEASAPVIHPGAQRFAHTMLVDAGMFDQTIDAVKQKLAPTLRQGFLDAPWAARLDQEKREKVGVYVDTIPDVIFAVLREELPSIETAVAIAYSQELTPEEANQIADYFGSENGLAFFKAMTSVTLNALKTTGKRPGTAELLAALTPQQVASANAFSATPGGKAFARVGGDKARTIMRDAIAKDMAAKRLPELFIKLRTDLCAIIGEPCPVPVP